MSALNLLSSLIGQALRRGAQEMRQVGDLDPVLLAMNRRAKARTGSRIPEDRRLEMVRHFWQTLEIHSFREACLLAWSLCTPHRLGGPCILEDLPHLDKLLNAIDEWRGQPRYYRRCYRGLVMGYFSYDSFGPKANPQGQRNWRKLRDYLSAHVSCISDNDGLTPEWATTTARHRQLFTDDPYGPYVESTLRGDTRLIDHLRQQLSIDQDSWFLRELVLGQVAASTRFGDAQFQSLLPQLLQLLADNGVLRDRGTVLLLNRYATIPGLPLHQGLRDRTVAWWGNPWLPSNATQWGGVSREARSMIADWLKLEFIETFFTKLAQDGLGDRRRMNFWRRYIKAITHIEFALGPAARHSQGRDFVVLREKMNGLLHTLDAQGENNAFIMTIGNLVLVEFSTLGNALYGYDGRKSLPFDLTKTLTLQTSLPNSLKQKDRAILWMSHHAATQEWSCWEDMFEAKLSEDFSIRPSDTPVPAARHQRSSVTSQPVSPASRRNSSTEAPPYSRKALDTLAHEYKLLIDDKSKIGGNLWVRTDSRNEKVSQILAAWGFIHKPGRGWWK